MGAVTSEQEWVADRARFAEDDGDWAGPLAGQFAEVGRLLLAGSTVAEVLERVVTAAKAVVPDADVVSVTLRAPSGIYTTPVRTDALADELDQLQYTHREGPCVEATRTPGAGLVGVDDLTQGSPWPRWGPAAARAGVHSVFSVGLFPAAPPRLGALNFYSRRPYGLAGLDRQLAIVLGGYAATALAATEAVTPAQLEAAQLREALQSRDVIGQAKGILMQRQGIGAEEAFDILCRTSQDLNIKLVQVATLLVNRRGEL
ncbi:ANTAR domain-containing protein [Amycolatopsis sacchari]|uniref:ANTAR domain-containing protein n=1 Tax=Amycolatopsis sacchari TaxID=115433 RepID=UPI003D7302F9